MSQHSCVLVPEHLLARGRRDTWAGVGGLSLMACPRFGKVPLTLPQTWRRALGSTFQGVPAAVPADDHFKLIF